MILEEATFIEFGHYPSKLKPKSHKPILAACNDCGKVREISKDQYRSLCNSCAMKGKTNSLGYKHTEETKTLMSIAAKGNTNSLGYTHTEEAKVRISAALKGETCEKNHNWKGGKVERICEQCKKAFEVWPSTIKNGGGKYCSILCRAKARCYNTHPVMTTPEKTFQNICQKFSLPFKFVGDRSLWLGNANPDFVHDTKKIVVEVFGDYWHSPLLRPVLRYNETVEGRTEQLKAEGYKCIILWESDLKRKDAESFIIHLMQKEKVI